MNCTGLDDKKRTNKIMQIYNFGEKLDNQDENQLNDSERAGAGQRTIIRKIVCEFLRRKKYV